MKDSASTHTGEGDSKNYGGSEGKRPVRIRPLPKRKRDHLCLWLSCDMHLCFHVCVRVGVGVGVGVCVGVYGCACLQVRVYGRQ